MIHSHGEITDLLQRWCSRQDGAFDALMEAAYDELRRLARWTISRGPACETLPPTALVNELYQSLARREKEPSGDSPSLTADFGQESFNSRAQFFAMTARKMRNILIDHARARRAAKRGGLCETLSLSQLSSEPSDRARSFEGMLGLHEALQRLGRIHRRQREVAELRFFGGLTEREAATALGTSLATVKRDWAAARHWLAWELRSGPDSKSDPGKPPQLPPAGRSERA